MCELGSMVEVIVLLMALFSAVIFFGARTPIKPNRRLSRFCLVIFALAPGQSAAMRMA